MIYNVSCENKHMQVESSSEVMEIIESVRQKCQDKKATCINIGTTLYNLDLWLLPIKNLAFLFFESMHKEVGEEKPKGNLISIEEAIRNAEYIMNNNCPAQDEQWHNCL